MAENNPPEVGLADTVAVVTSASRGASRGIALELGSAGATVYVTGRSVDGDSIRDDLPGTTIDETAGRVTERGGVGVAVRCDHTVYEQIWQEDSAPECTESPHYIGRVLAALAADIDVME